MILGLNLLSLHYVSGILHCMQQLINKNPGRLRAWSLNEAE